MNKILIVPTLLCLVANSLFNASVASAADTGKSAVQSSKAEQDRDERIRFNLRQGAFHLNGGLYTKNASTRPDAPSPLKGLSQEQVKDRLQEWGVSYLFRLDESDLKKPEDSPTYVIDDFLGNATAESRGGNKFQAQVCKDGQSTSRAARFERISSQDSTGAYLLVKETEPSTTNLSAFEGFSMGSWIQIKDGVTSGAFPILSKSRMNQINAPGKNEWSFWVTGNVVYLNINRQGRTQNLNFGIPWWGDRFGSCYEGGIYRECWHYVGLSFDPEVNKISVLFLRKFANKFPGPMTENFYNHETSAEENSLAIEGSQQTPLRLGGMNGASMNGILKGVFFAKKSLSYEELKAVAEWTQPKEDGLFCNPR
jgi:hypothetical protein